MKAPLLVAALLAVLAAFGWGLRELRRHRTQLETRVGTLRAAAPTVDVAEAQAENRRLAQLAAQLRRNDREADSALRAELELARREVAELERRAVQHPPKSGAAPAPDNRDLEKGFVRLEYLPNAGRATPAATLQTLVWAALKSDDRLLASALALDADARVKATELLATLPPETRARYGTPESLAALFLADDVLNTRALQLMATTFPEPQQAVVTIHRFEHGERPHRLAMVLGPDGWQLSISVSMIEGIKRRLQTAP